MVKKMLMQGSYQDAHVLFGIDEVYIIVVDDNKRGRGFGGQFLNWIEVWLKTKGYKSIHTESSPDAVQFYKNQAYTEMPFNDPDGYEGDERDTPMGKILESAPFGGS